MSHRPLDWDRTRPDLSFSTLRLALRALLRSGLWRWLGVQALEERERWILWLPVAFGTGVAVYFALPAEPPLWFGVGGLLAALLLIGWQRWRGTELTLAPWWPWLLALAAVTAGLSIAQMRTAGVAAPVLERRAAYVLEGRVLLAEDRVSGQRLLLDDLVIEGLEVEATPAQLRVSVRRAMPDLIPGDRVSMRAMLMPPSPPAAPGDFDFARQAYFQRLGAVGYALGDASPIAQRQGVTPVQWITGVRQRAAAEINAALPGTTGAVANALLTGLRAAIPDDVWYAMQVAGLAHLLAISGLHLGLVAGTLFFAARIAIALVPPLALRLPGKKAAAMVALVGALGYLLLSGAPVPTQRAFIMTGIGLIAIMADRNPFSMRLVAFAAFVVLLLQPESLLGASFQMSFSAVIALIAVYETSIARRPYGAGGLDWRLLLYVAGVALTTLVASFATAPASAYHFNRLPTYGIAANLIAVPLTAFWIMPLGLLGMLLMPLGLGAGCLLLMGHGIDLVLGLAAAVADLPGAVLMVPQVPVAALAIISLGGLWLCLWRQPWRRLGLLALPPALLLSLLHQPPDLLIEERGQIVAVRRADGRLAISPWERDAWITGGWLRRAGQVEAADWPEPGTPGNPDLRCDALGCVVAKAGLTVALARRPEALEGDCAAAGLVISYPRIERCPGGTPLIGPNALRRMGGLALWLEPDGIATRSVREERGDRPWAR